MNAKQFLQWLLSVRYFSILAVTGSAAGALKILDLKGTKSKGEQG